MTARSVPDTPMFRQYTALKDQHPDALLFFRMGDFYELFFDDAEVAAKVLDIVLTSRNRNDPDPIPMCGVPHHSAESYLARLIEAGHKVAIADQVEDPRKARGLVKREVVRVVSPGVVMDPEGLEAKESNYLVGVVREGSDRYGLALLEATTGDLRVTEPSSWEAVLVEFARVRPREALLHPHLVDEPGLEEVLSDCLVNRPGRDWFRHEPATALLRKVLGVADLAGFGAADMRPALTAAGALLRYARENSHTDLDHVNTLVCYHPGAHMVIDEATRRNLEIQRPLRGTGRQGTLLGLLDRTATAMGGRLLREWLGAPLLDPRAIDARLDAVETLLDDFGVRESLRSRLREVADLERIGSKLTQQSAHARDLASLRRSLAALPRILEDLRTLPALEAYLPRDLCHDVHGDLAKWLVDEPPLSLTEGGLIREGADEELDELLQIARKGRGGISELEARERRATGIGSLHIRHHRSHGYYIEVTRANLHRVPSHYRRWQTLTNSERYFTPELKEFEEKVLSARTRLESMEYELFVQLRDRVARAIPRLQELARTVALLDVFACLAEVAERYRYVRPRLTTGETLILEEARHPVVETTLTEEQFVPNDLEMDPDRRRLVVLTGPNMSGKSTVMRQVGLIALMAQAGSFVPARHAEIGICDRIFVRVGASDDLSRGRSTFMVEMAETANILHNATRRSLVLLDEIGRGTSTYDGMAIAWAVAEALHDRIRARTLFATHYHELVGFARKHPRAVNMRVAVNQMGEEIIFLRRLQDGATSRSYGIQCARLAGMPHWVVHRSRELLKELERQRPRDDRQLSLFDMDPGTGPDVESDSPSEPQEQDLPPAEPAPPGPGSLLIESLSALQPDELTPREALDALYRLKAMVPARDHD